VEIAGIPGFGIPGLQSLVVSNWPDSASEQQCAIHAAFNQQSAYLAPDELTFNSEELKKIQNKKNRQMKII